MMKRLIFGALILLATNVGAQEHANHTEESESEEHHCLFKKNSISVGVGLPYSIPLNQLGINSRFYYNIGEHICFGPEFSLFKKDELQILEFNLIGHYIFETKLVGLYPLLGVNYTEEKEHHESNGAFGVVFGGGLHRNVKLFTFFAEYAHVQSELKDDFLTVGIMLNIK